MQAIKRRDYDTPWKNILEIYFQPFLEFCCPTMAADIDWTQACQFLDKELRAITKGFNHREVDLLVKVFRKNGENCCVLLHCEQQANPLPDFEERVFIYRSRLYDRYRLPIATITLLTDKNRHWRPSYFRSEIWGSVLETRYSILKITDFETRKNELEASDNPFAIVILGQLAEMEAKTEGERYQAKIRLIYRLFEKKLNRKDIQQLYIFLDWMIVLPENLEVCYNDALIQLEETYKVAYITTAERIGIRKGFKQGIEQGIEQGKNRIVVRLLEEGLLSYEKALELTGLASGELEKVRLKDMKNLKDDLYTIAK